MLLIVDENGWAERWVLEQAESRAQHRVLDLGIGGRPERIAVAEGNEESARWADAFGHLA